VLLVDRVASAANVAELDTDVAELEAEAIQPAPSSPAPSSSS
jgi:hypothetical protein